MERFKAVVEEGLNKEQVQQRIKEGLINYNDLGVTKSYQQIVKDNVFTLFNFINLVLAALICTTGSYKNLLFLGVMFSNMFIGIVQEIRAKRTLDKISLIEHTKVCVIRDGKEQMIAANELVLDDIVHLKAGNQIVADCIVVEGTLEVNEALLSGEGEAVVKKENDFLYSGSYVSGSWGYVRVEKVGEECYASKMVKDARKFSKYPSELRDSLDKIIKYIGLMIIPLGVCLFIKDFWILHTDINTCILSISAALIGMIPEGLVILTSVALAVGVIHLAKHRTLVQELYCLETLARVDVLCLDKTGTITEGILEVDQVILMAECDLDEIMGNMLYYLQDANATYNALNHYFIQRDSLSFVYNIPFNSERKYSGVHFNEGVYLMGAYECIVDMAEEEILQKINTYALEGYRVITVVKKEGETFKVLALILLLDKIRASARQTLDYFMKQDVDIRVISGDHPLTVSQAAKRAGLKYYDRYVDASTLDDETIEKAVQQYHVFGRVTPQQKKKIILALKQKGHVVGMSGDGVNDVPAFKSADVSIAMASGSDIAKSSANLVLLDSNFDALPYVLKEGRRVINNIQRVATLFLTKTIFSFLLACVTLFVAFKYPFMPIHLTFVSTLTIGIPAFLMALEPNYKRVEQHFLENVICVSVPAAVSVLCAIGYVYVTAWMHHASYAQISQLAVVAISVNGLIVLLRVAFPLTRLRSAILIFSFTGIVFCLLFGSTIFEFARLSISQSLQVCVIVAVLMGISQFVTVFIHRFIYRD